MAGFWCRAVPGGVTGVAPSELVVIGEHAEERLDDDAVEPGVAVTPI